MIGDVLFFRKTNSFISKTIANITNSEFTHVALILDYSPETREVTIIESDRFIKTREAKLKLDNTRHVIYSLDGKTSEMSNRIVKSAKSQLGTGYDYIQILGLFLSLLFKSGRIKYFDNKNRYICSELVDYSYYLANAKRKNNENVGNISPSELFFYYDLHEKKG